MHRIDSSGTAVALPTPGDVGATVGYFTEGDPSSAVPATEVSADWLNAVQEELIAVITQAGASPDKTSRTQVRDAIISIMENNDTQATFTVANNQSVAADVTGLLFSSGTYRGFVIDIEIYRKDAVQEKACVGKISGWFKPVLNSWEITVDLAGDDCGVTFTVSAAGQLKYASTNFAGGSYVGELRAKVKRFKI